MLSSCKGIQKYDHHMHTYAGVAGGAAKCECDISWRVETINSWLSSRMQAGHEKWARVNETAVSHGKRRRRFRDGNRMLSSLMLAPPSRHSSQLPPGGKTLTPPNAATCRNDSPNSKGVPRIRFLDSSQPRFSRTGRSLVAPVIVDNFCRGGNVR